jgi:hypothetical protein
MTASLLVLESQAQEREGDEKAWTKTKSKSSEAMIPHEDIWK